MVRDVRAAEKAAGVMTVAMMVMVLIGVVMFLD